MNIKLNFGLAVAESCHQYILQVSIDFMSFVQKFAFKLMYVVDLVSLFAKHLTNHWMDFTETSKGSNAFQFLNNEMMFFGRQFL